MHDRTDTLVDIRWFKSEGQDAEAEVMALPSRSRTKALALLRRLSSLNRSQFRVKPTYVGSIFEAKLDTPEGGLRLLFVYGRSNVWCIGGFVKPNDKEGNRTLKRYLERSKIAEKQ